MLPLPAAARPNCVLPLAPGPRDDWFTADALRTLAAGALQRVARRRNRIGAAHRRARAGARPASGELPSEGMVPGAVQVPPDGRPMVFLADHPTTGGYPVIGVVPSAALAAAAQAPPGHTGALRARTAARLG